MQWKPYSKHHKIRLCETMHRNTQNFLAFLFFWMWKGIGPQSMDLVRSPSGKKFHLFTCKFVTIRIVYALFIKMSSLAQFIWILITYASVILQHALWECILLFFKNFTRRNCLCPDSALCLLLSSFLQFDFLPSSAILSFPCCRESIFRDGQLASV